MVTKKRRDFNVDLKIQKYNDLSSAFYNNNRVLKLNRNP